MLRSQSGHQTGQAASGCPALAAVTGLLWAGTMYCSLTGPSTQGTGEVLSLGALRGLKRKFLGTSQAPLGLGALSTALGLSSVTGIYPPGWQPWTPGSETGLQSQLRTLAEPLRPTWPLQVRPSPKAGGEEWSLNLWAGLHSNSQHCGYHPKSQMRKLRPGRGE